MDKDKKARGVLRSSFTRKIKCLQDELSREDRDEFKIRGLVELLEKKRGELTTLNSRIYDLKINDDNVDEATLEQELEDNDRYDLQLNELIAKVAALGDINHDETDSRVSCDQKSAHPETKRRFQLPKLELKKFNGELREWLPFWSQFKKIDEDNTIEDGDKFQYLIQATVTGSKARDLVESFPATSENYIKVMQCLKKRYGRDELLVEVYVRDLLALVLQNTTSSKKISLSNLYDKLECQLRALETLQVTTDRCACMLMPLVESCLPEEILRAWQRSGYYTVAYQGGSIERDQVSNSHIENTSKYRLDQLMIFLRTELENEQKIKLALSAFGVENPPPKGDYDRKKDRGLKGLPYNKTLSTAAGLLTTSKDVNCVFCDNSHRNTECDKATKMSLVERTAILNKKRCCYNCLKMGHPVKTCWSKTRCAACKGKHHVLICEEVFGLEGNINKEKKTVNMNVQCNKRRSKSTNSSQVILQTFLVKLKGKETERVARAIIDTASQRSYILRSVAIDMGYESVRKEKVRHALFGGVNTNIIQHEVFIAHLSDMNDNYQCEFQVLDQKVICGEINPINAGPWLHELKQYGIQLTDFENTQIEILIGADVAAKLYTGRMHELSTGLLAVETRLGWTVLGCVPENSKGNNIATMVTTLLVKEADISDLWSLDVLGITDPSEKKRKQELQAEAEDHFLRTVTIDEEGRYSVHLPWLDNHPPLSTNYRISLNRLQTTVKRLKSDGLYDQYDKVFKEWEREGVIEEVRSDELKKLSHYLPHRHIVKENSTTRIRPVFDASAKEKNCPSLNNCLEKGINLIELIPSILIRFRMEKIGVISDIRKAFLQISLFEKDKDFLRFLWYDQSGQLRTFRHRRVVFGVTSSPFLLGSVVQYHLQNVLKKCKEGDKNYQPSVLKKLMNSFYVDNCVTSVADEDKLKRFIKEASDVMREASFDLRGWEYTHQDSANNNDLSNVLGLLWDRQNDTLEVKVENYDNPFDNLQTTKRAILSAAHRVFDPIGVTSPVMILPKVLLQQIWSQKIGWDQPVNEHIEKQFLKWRRELIALKQIRVSRWLIGTNASAVYTLHVFCDASQTAYATAIFLRTKTATGVNLELVQAKSRVCPVGKQNKRITIPRLELLAATIGVRLYKSIVNDLKVHLEEVIFWSDSTTVLAWISREEQWDVFVRNRVKEIKEITSDQQWRHVPGICNPADLPSRGCSAKKLIDSQWWKGPNWLSNSENDWPSSNISYDEEEINQEKKKTVTSSAIMICTNSGTGWYYKYFSKYKQIVRLVAWLIRFKQNSLAKRELRIYGDLTTEEVLIAERRVIQLIQKDYFTGLDDPKLLSLCPFMDQNNLIRLKTKISNSDYDKNFCLPVVLPDHHHPVIQRLIWEKHFDSSHAGTQTLLTLLRKHFWILGGRRTVRAVINKCPKCKRYTSKGVEVQSPPLPMDRVREAKIFEIIGIDFAGPVYLKGGDKAAQQKAWICLFTCAVYRAVHLELVSSLSTDGFIQCLRKFISRRGRPKIIYTDNGTNFVGAANALARVDWREITSCNATAQIRWKFNPPAAPWWGGWWERLIGLLKQLLRRILGRTSLNFEDMQTILCECESVLNSRPLTYLSEDPSDLMPLTPDMFLKEIEDSGVPDLDSVEAGDVSRRIKYRGQIRRILKERFHSEYMGQLILHAKRISPKTIEVGELVLVGSDNTKRIDWPLARVEELIPGNEGVVRLVKLRTSSGILLRPIQRVFPLEIRFGCSEKTRDLIHHLSEERPLETTVKEAPEEEIIQTTHTRSGRKVNAPSRLGI